MFPTLRIDIVAVSWFILAFTFLASVVFLASTFVAPLFYPLAVRWGERLGGRWPWICGRLRAAYAAFRAALLKAGDAGYYVLDAFVGALIAFLFALANGLAWVITELAEIFREALEVLPGVLFFLGGLAWAAEEGWSGRPEAVVTFFFLSGMLEYRRDTQGRGPLFPLDPLDVMLFLAFTNACLSYLYDYLESLDYSVRLLYLFIFLLIVVGGPTYLLMLLLR